MNVGAPFLLSLRFQCYIIYDLLVSGSSLLLVSVSISANLWYHLIPLSHQFSSFFLSFSFCRLEAFKNQGSLTVSFLWLLMKVYI